MLLGLLARGVGMGGGASAVVVVIVPRVQIFMPVEEFVFEHDRGLYFLIKGPLPETIPTPDQTFDLEPIGRDPWANPRTRRLESLAQSNFDTIAAMRDVLIAPSIGPTGPKGERGDKGETGPAGAAGVSASGIITKYTITYANLATSATTNVYDFLFLPPKTTLLFVWAKHAQAFTGGALADYNVLVTLGSGLLSGGHFGSLSVFNPPTNSNFSPPLPLTAVLPFPFTTFDGDNLRISAGATGVNLDQATQGILEVWVMSATLP